jgi:hypothetical protein
MQLFLTVLLRGGERERESERENNEIFINVVMHQILQRIRSQMLNLDSCLS